MLFKKLFFLLSFILANTSADSHSISGKIVDTKSIVIPGVSLHLLNTNIFAISDANGNFEIKNLLPGHYEITISAEGYATNNLNIVIITQNIILTVKLMVRSVQLDAVVITAEKKETSLQSTPISITAISERQVREYRLWDSKDLTAIIPNLYAANPGDGRNVTSIRGITSTSYDPAVATYIDGVNQFSLDTYIPQLFDVERIEVLRGPQGTLYGRNAMGGVINIITRQPTNKTDGFFEVSLGNYRQQRFTTGMRIPILKNKLFFGGPALYEGLKGYYLNEYTNSNFDKQHSFGGNY